MPVGLSSSCGKQRMSGPSTQTDDSQSIAHSQELSSVGFKVQDILAIPCVDGTVRAAGPVDV